MARDENGEIRRSPLDLVRAAAFNRETRHMKEISEDPFVPIGLLWTNYLIILYFLSPCRTSQWVIDARNPNTKAQ